jgi:transposase
MQDRDLYTAVLRIAEPWFISKVELSASEEEVEVFVEARGRSRMPCPECGAESGVHDRRERRWRHLDTCEYRTTIVAQVPRVQCPEHGVRQVSVPWGDPGSRYTKAFESFAIGWLLEAPVSAVARRLRLSWGQVDRIMQRAVQRGLARREELAPTRIGIDETSFQKRHEYVTVVTDLESSKVLYVADDRKAQSLEGFFDLFEPADLLKIEAVCMDMWQPYISVVEWNLHRAEEKICFDKFHIAKHLGDAVNKVRRQEQRHLIEQGDRSLVGTKYTWLRNPERLPAESTGFFERMKRIAIRTARAWAIKEQAMCLWHYTSRGWARKAWRAWIAWATRSRLEPVKRVARMVRDHLEGIINAIVLRATNAGAESVNSKIQRVKRMACGFRNRERFRNAIYFHLGGLDLLPEPHTKR